MTAGCATAQASINSVCKSHVQLNSLLAHTFVIRFFERAGGECASVGLLRGVAGVLLRFD